jgi:hypothetical protein
MYRQRNIAKVPLLGSMPGSLLPRFTRVGIFKAKPGAKHHLAVDRQNAPFMVCKKPAKNCAGWEIV